MKTSSALAMALALLTAGAAQAQTAASRPAPKTGDSTVSGVTVEGRKTPSKTCAARDKDCISVVVAELKARFPEQLQKWCQLVEWRAAATNMNIDDLNGSLNSPGTHSEAGNFMPPAVAKVACSTDKPKEKAQ